MLLFIIQLFIGFPLLSGMHLQIEHSNNEIGVKFQLLLWPGATKKSI